MTRLQEVEKLLDNNLQLITDYTKRAAELIGSVRVLEKERDKLTKKNRGLEVVRCKDCVKLNRHDCSECAADHRQLAEWLTELKEAKRLLKAAVEDFRWLESHTEDEKGHCCISGDNNELACIHCPLNQRNKDTIMCGWNYEAEALALIGEEGEQNG